MQPTVVMPSSDRLTRRVAAAIGEAGWAAAACSLIAVVAYALEWDAIVARGGVSLLGLLGIYAGCAIVSGTVLGIMRPLTAGWLGSALVSIPVAWPVAFSAMLLSRDGRLRDMDSLDFAISFALAIVLGPIAAAYVRIRRRK